MWVKDSGLIKELEEAEGIANTSRPKINCSQNG